MSDSSLRTLLATDAPNHAAAVRPNDESDYRAYAFGRVSIRSELMIEFIKSDGYHLVLPYMDLKSIATSDPAKGCVIEFHLRKVTIIGVNLSDLLRYLRQNRVSVLIEHTRSDAMEAASDEPVIHQMKIESSKG